MLPTEWTRRRVLFHVFRATCAAFEGRLLLDPPAESSTLPRPFLQARL